MNYIKENEIDLAKEAYKEIINVYNSFPEGFIETNLKIRDKIIRLYKDILSKETRPLIGEADTETEKLYTELLKLLVVIHDQIKKKQFHNVKEKYLLAYRLYHELPLSFLEKKTMLYTELYKIYEELKLYSEVMKLPEYANNKEYDKLKQSLSLIIDSHGKLLKRYPEDIELFRFVHGKCLLYMDLLKGLEPKTGLAVREKVENHVEQKKMPEIQKSKEIKEHEQNQNHIIEQTSMPGIHPSGSYSEEKEQPKILSAMEYLKKKYHPLG
ncbi:MAG: hypothetical protein KKE20_01575, partial [Nanoarchaeota archaeon]|nr:hypothetical protein [Nanoarchaeota archaeon]